jgi:hypothetical protein
VAHRNCVTKRFVTLEVFVRIKRLRNCDELNCDLRLRKIRSESFGPTSDDVDEMFERYASIDTSRLDTSRSKAHYEPVFSCVRGEHSFSRVLVSLPRSSLYDRFIEVKPVENLPHVHTKIRRLRT